LKSSAQMVGAIKLSELAQNLEGAGNAGNLEEIHDKTEALLEMLMSLRGILKQYAAIGEMQEDQKQEISIHEIVAKLMQLKSSMTVLDLDKADEIIKKLDSVKIPKNMKATYEILKESVANVDCERVDQIIKNMTAGYLL